MPKTDVAMVVLHAFALQFAAILRLKAIGSAVGVGGVVIFLSTLVVFEPGTRIMDLAAVGPAIELHLEDAQVEPQLDLPLAVVPLNDADGDLVWPVGPIFQNGVDVPGHVRSSM